MLHSKLLHRYMKPLYNVYVMQATRGGRQAAVACLAALQLGVVPLALDIATPAPSSARLNSPNAQIPR